jgi:hypothetical protein
MKMIAAATWIGCRIGFCALESINAPKFLPVFFLLLSKSVLGGRPSPDPEPSTSTSVKVLRPLSSRSDSASVPSHPVPPFELLPSPEPDDPKSAITSESGSGAATVLLIKT